MSEPAASDSAPDGGRSGQLPSVAAAIDRLCRSESFDARPVPQAVAQGALVPVSDSFTSVEQRLRQLGATYYRLETWGNEGEQFRFQCGIALGREVGPARYFEAVAPDAVEAMAKVLGQVQSWRSDRDRD